MRKLLLSILLSSTLAFGYLSGPVSGGGGGGGSGDVVGPASSTDNGIPRYDGLTGKLLQGSGLSLDDDGNLQFAHNSSGSINRILLGTLGAFISSSPGGESRLILAAGSTDQLVQLCHGSSARCGADFNASYMQMGLYDGSTPWTHYEQVGRTDQINGRTRFMIYTGNAGYANSSTTETDLFTKTIHAKVMDADDQELPFTCWGTFAANANNKTGKIYMDGSSRGTWAPTSGYNGTTWVLRGGINRTGATSVKYWWESSAGTVHLGTGSGTAAITVGSDWNFHLSGQSGTASNDIVNEGCRIGHDSAAY